MMDREAAPGGVRFLGPHGERSDEVAVVKLDLERNAGEVLRGKLKRWLRQIDAVIVPDLGAGERLPHLACIAAGNVEKGEGLSDVGERPMQDRSYFLMGERIVIDQFLIGRPLLLKLLERGAVGDRAFGMKVMNVDGHACAGRGGGEFHKGLPRASAFLRITSRRISCSTSVEIQIRLVDSALLHSTQQ